MSGVWPNSLVFLIASMVNLTGNNLRKVPPVLTTKFPRNIGRPNIQNSYSLLPLKSN